MADRLNLAMWSGPRNLSTALMRSFGNREDIIEVIDEPFYAAYLKESKKSCTGKSVKCITHNLWDDLENHINSFFEKNTLNDIIFKFT